MEQFRAAIEKDRDHPDANLALAKRLEAEGRPEEARESLRHASHARPSSFEIAMALGDLAFRANDLVEAEEAFSRPMRFCPRTIAPPTTWARCSSPARRYSEAIELLRPLSEREDPTPAVFNLAEAYRATGASSRRETCAESLVERHPRSRARASLWA
jgi:predicted Zn-dependent protease